MGVVKF